MSVALLYHVVLKGFGLQFHITAVDSIAILDVVLFVLAIKDILGMGFALAMELAAVRVNIKVDDVFSILLPVLAGAHKYDV